MFALPTVAMTPILNGFEMVAFPPIDGAFYGWFLIAALIVTAFGILRAAFGRDSGRASEDLRPATRQNRVTHELPSKLAA